MWQWMRADRAFFWLQYEKENNPGSYVHIRPNSDDTFQILLTFTATQQM